MEQLIYYWHRLWGYVRTTFLRPFVKQIGKRVNIGRHIQLHGCRYIHIAECVTIDNHVVLTAWNVLPIHPAIYIGAGTAICRGCHITAANAITIGKNVVVSAYVTITDNAHGDNSYRQMNISPYQRPVVSKGTVVIEDNVWIGEKVTILPNVHIGYGAVIGANSVVTQDIPPYSVAVGIPARIVKTNQPCQD